MASIHDEVSSSIFLTPFVQALLILLLFCAFIFNISELIFFAVALVITAFFSYLWAVFSLYNVDVSVESERNLLFHGESFKIGLEVNNRKFLPVLFQADLFIENLVVKGGGQRKEGCKRSVFWFQKSSFVFDFSPSERGVYFVHSPDIKVGDLFGFSFRKKRGNTGAELIVYPRIPEINNFKIKGMEYSGTKKGMNAVPDHLLINGTRNYQSGSSLRDIHWKSSAKHSRLMEKVFDSAQKEKVLVLFDVNNFNKDKNTLERSLEAAAASVVKLSHEGIPVGFFTNGNIFRDSLRHIPVSGNRNQTVLILETLARIEEGNGKDMAEFLKRGRYLPHGVSCLYFASSFSQELDSVSLFLKTRRIPVQYILSEQDSPGFNGSDFLPLDSLLAEGKYAE